MYYGQTMVQRYLPGPTTCLLGIKLPSYSSGALKIGLERERWKKEIVLISQGENWGRSIRAIYSCLKGPNICEVQPTFSTKM